jgi:hypothetical protein
MNTAAHPAARLCRNLRTKKMYVPAEAPDVLEQASGERPGEPHCWCNRTIGRTCYE